MRWQRGVSMAIATTLTAALVASCSGGSAESKPKGNAVQIPPDNSSNSMSNVTVKAMWMYVWFKGKKWGADPVTKRITEKTGVQFDFSGPDGDGEQKANVMLISGDYPEVMWMDRGPTWDNYVNSKALLPIDVLAAKYGYDKLIGTYIPQHVVDQLKHPDGHLYGIPNWFSDKGELSVGRTLMLREDIYEKMGKPEIKTVKDFEAYLAKVRNANLSTTNGEIVFPLGLDYNDGSFIEMSNMWGSKNKDYRYYDEKEQKVKFFMFNESTKDMLLWLNKMYREKMIDPENFSYNDGMEQEVRSNGKWAASFSAIWDYWTPNAVLKKTDPGIYYKAYPIPAGKDGVKPYMGGYSTVGWNVAVITKNAKHPEAIMRFFNYYMSPEGQMLSFYGIEGETWEMKDGSPVLKQNAYEEFQKDWDGYSQKTGVRYLELNQYQKYNWEKQSESPDRQEDRRIAELFKFDGTSLSVLSIDPNSKAGIVWANIQSGLLTDIAKVLIADSAKDARARLEELLDKYAKMGIKDVEEEWTKQYQERQKLK